MTPETLAWIQKKKPKLVAWAENYVKRTKLYCATRKSLESKSLRKDPEVKTNQLRNLLTAAQAGDPLALLTNFLRYQVGREKQAWRHKVSAEALLDDFEGKLAKMCDEILGPDDDGRFELEAHVAAQYIGFVIREYTYRCALEGTRP